MAAINFPSSPSNGDTHVVDGVTYTYNSAETKWKTTINSNAFLPLSGGNVTGNLSVDTDTLYVDSANNRVGVGTSSPSKKLEISASSSEAGIALTSSGRTLVMTSHEQVGVSQAAKIGTSSNHELRIITNNTERFRIGSAGQLGIGGATYGTSGQVLTSQGSGSAPTWSDRAQKTAVQVTNTNTTNEYFFTNIPTWANIIIINFHETGVITSQDLLVQLGSDGTYYASNYRSNSVNQAGTSGNYRTNCFVLDTIGTTPVLGGHMILTNLRRRTGSVTGLWSESHSVMDTSSGNGTRQGGGIFINNTGNGDINCIRIATTSSNFDTGRISITYM